MTVVVPSHARWSLLGAAALPAALSQEDVAVEVVVVDDGSPERAPAGLPGLADPRVRVLRHEQPRGVAAARNAGIAAARGAWVAFLDDDDLWAPHKLRAQLDAARAGGAGFAYGAAIAVDERRRPLFAFRHPDPARLRRALHRWNEVPAGASNVVARAELVRSLGGFDERLVQLSDWDLWIRLADAAPAAACDEVLVAYTVHGGSMLLTDPRDVFSELDLLERKHAAAAAELGVRPDRALFSRWVGRGRRRAGRRAAAAATYLRGAVRHRDPGAAVRALAALGGEPLTARARALTRPEPPPAAPDWLSRYAA